MKTYIRFIGGDRCYEKMETRRFHPPAKSSIGMERARPLAAGANASFNTAINTLDNPIYGNGTDMLPFAQLHTSALFAINGTGL